MKMKLASLVLMVIGLGVASLNSGCAANSSATTQPTLQQVTQGVGNVSVGLGWIGYGISYDLAEEYAAQGRISPTAATKITKDFQTSYDAIMALESFNSTLATTQPTAQTYTQQALIVGNAALQIQNDLHGVPPGANAPIVLNIPMPPATTAPIPAQ